jgi:hypothetical protein
MPAGGIGLNNGMYGMYRTGNTAAGNREGNFL